MKSLFVWLNRIIRKHKAMKRWQRIVTVLAAVMTFVTTYALILPAITVEKNTAEDVGGMYLDAAEDPVLQPDEALETGRHCAGGNTDICHHVCADTSCDYC